MVITFFKKVNFKSVLRLAPSKLNFLCVYKGIDWYQFQYGLCFGENRPLVRGLISLLRLNFIFFSPRIIWTVRTSGIWVRKEICWMLQRSLWLETPPVFLSRYKICNLSRNENAKLYTAQGGTNVVGAWALPPPTQKIFWNNRGRSPSFLLIFYVYLLLLFFIFLDNFPFSHLPIFLWWGEVDWIEQYFLGGAKFPKKFSAFSLYVQHSWAANAAPINRRVSPSFWKITIWIHNP